MRYLVRIAYVLLLIVPFKTMAGEAVTADSFTEKFKSLSYRFERASEELTSQGSKELAQKCRGAQMQALNDYGLALQLETGRFLATPRMLNRELEVLQKAIEECEGLPI